MNTRPFNLTLAALVCFSLAPVIQASDGKETTLEGTARIANPHPASGVEIEPEKIYIETKGKTLDPLQNCVARGNLGRTGLWDTKGLRTAPSLKWKFQTGGPVESSPVVVNNTVYVGSGDKCVYAIDATSGKLRWKFQTGGEVISSPAIANGIVYIGSADSALYALNARTGEKVWSTPAKTPVPNDRRKGVRSSPAPAYGVVIADNDIYLQGLMAWDAATGEKVARFVKGVDGWNSGWVHSPAIADGKMTYKGLVDLRTGRVLPFKIQFGEGYPYENGLAICDGTVFTAIPNAMIATNLKTGEFLWGTWLFNFSDIKAAGKIEVQMRDQHRVKCSPGVHAGRVFIGSLDGNLYAFETTKGKPVWTHDAQAAIWSSPVLTPDGTVYIGCDDGNIHGLDVATGNLLWSFKTDGAVRSSACVADGSLYVGSADGNIYAISAKK